MKTLKIRKLRLNLNQLETRGLYDDIITLLEVAVRLVSFMLKITAIHRFNSIKLRLFNGFSSAHLCLQIELQSTASTCFLSAAMLSHILNERASEVFPLKVNHHRVPSLKCAYPVPLDSWTPVSLFATAVLSSNEKRSSNLWCHTNGPLHGDLIGIDRNAYNDHTWGHTKTSPSLQIEVLFYYNSRFILVPQCHA